MVVNDVSTNSEFVPLSYASSILRELKTFLKKHFYKISSTAEYGRDAEDEEKIEKALKDLFLRQTSSFTFVTVESLKEVMVY